MRLVECSEPRLLEKELKPEEYAEEMAKLSDVGIQQTFFVTSATPPAVQVAEGAQSGGLSNNKKRMSGWGGGASYLASKMGGGTSNAKINVITGSSVPSPPTRNPRASAREYTSPSREYSTNFQLSSEKSEVVSVAEVRDACMRAHAHRAAVAVRVRMGCLWLSELGAHRQWGELVRVRAAMPSHVSSCAWEGGARSRVRGVVGARGWR